MTSTPRIFVGTLYSGEAEFAQCRRQIEAQDGVTVAHKVIADMPELEAHNALWAAWSAAKANFDIFVKVDADTILIGQHALGRIAELFTADREVTGAQVPLHDYFTDQQIVGLNAFSPAVVFTHTRNRLHSDRVDTNHTKVLRGADVAHLAPIGHHCRYPNPIQSFRFGLHRALKRQHTLLKRVAEVWQRDGGDARCWALAGALAARSQLMRGGQDYRSRRLQRRFERFQADDLARQRRVERFAARLL